MERQSANRVRTGLPYTIMFQFSLSWSVLLLGFSTVKGKDFIRMDISLNKNKA